MATAEHRTAGGAGKDSLAAAATDPLNDSARKELPRYEGVVVRRSCTHDWAALSMTTSMDADPLCQTAGTIDDHIDGRLGGTIDDHIDGRRHCVSLKVVVLLQQSENKFPTQRNEKI